MEPRKVPDTTIPISTFTQTPPSAGLDKGIEPLTSPKGDGLFAAPLAAPPLFGLAPQGTSTTESSSSSSSLSAAVGATTVISRPAHKPLTIKYDDNDDDDDEDDDPIIDEDDEDEEDPEDDGGEYGGSRHDAFERDFPGRTSLDFGEDGMVESSGKGGAGYGDEDEDDLDSPRLPDRCGNPITNNQMFTVDNNQPSSYTSRFVPAGGRGPQSECKGAELGLLSLSPPRLYYNPSSSGTTQTTISF